MTDKQKKIDQICINTIRMLAVDMVEKAKSGHPGLPLGAAAMAYVLWTRFLSHNPENPQWPNRDRFILSAGHGSALLYALLHLSGYDLPMEELKNFRQWESRTPGHPEYGLTPGVEATTGPLGQGFAMGVGMAVAEAVLADSFNQGEHKIVDHYTYALVSDGDLMEGVASEAASLAGTLALDKLIYLYDDNGISIEGSTDLAFTEDVSRRFQAYGWQVIRVANGNNVESIETAINNARGEKDRPSLIMIKTNIGFGSPKQDSSSAHGEPLGPEAARETKKFFDWPANSDFYVPDEVYEHFASIKALGQEKENEWRQSMDEYRQSFPQEAKQFEQRIQGVPAESWENNLPSFEPSEGPVATRSASGKVLNSLAQILPHLMGGSADLAPSNKTMLDGYSDFGSGQEGARNMHFGVREHAMGAMINGMALHGGLIPYAGTFLVFADYMRPAIRLAALMNVPSIFIFTHDSIGVGEDGPTHQPVEHLASLRAIPNLTVIRPADANETTAAWRCALENHGPTALILSRQKLPILDTSQYPINEGTARGAYILHDTDSSPDIILIATGSEVHLALSTAGKLSEEGVKARVVSMPSWELFQAQSQEYRDQVLPPDIKARLALEAGIGMGWGQWVGAGGDVISVDRFGVSAPGGEAMKQFGYTEENVSARAKAVISG
jgi:transketolase